MTNAFHTHIRQALNDPNLQKALDNNAERRTSAWKLAYASLPEPWEVMRQRAHNVRRGVIDQLPELVKHFAQQAEEQGFIVHQAETGAAAVEIVRTIAHQHQARLVAKSKTMVSEEIELNHALELDGLRVVETDLGEYIVQLRGERPGHIITPAVHLQRGQVGETFHQQLGIPLTDDIPTLTAVARETLRQVFLEADVGISGVNFGVVESGSLCIVTNEGNGRMVTTLPQVHIALMGLERLVPTWDDLALLLQLLPRSSTGQKLTVYTNLIHGPRRPDEPDGPSERHLILVDNGRSGLRASPLKEALLCIRCGACLNACPVFREIGGHAYVNRQGQGSAYPGPIGSVVSPGLFGQGDFGHLARASSLCGACREACPVDIDLPKLLLRVRAGQSPSNLSPEQRRQPGSAPEKTNPPETPLKPNAPFGLAWGLRMFTWAATSARRFAAAQRLAGWVTGLLPRTGNWLHMPAFTGWGANKDLPQPAARPFRERWSARTSQAGGEIPTPPVFTPPAEGDSSPTIPIVDPLADPDARRARFKEDLEVLGGHLVPGSTADLVARLSAFLREREISSLQTWSSDHFPPGMLAALESAGFQCLTQPDPELRAGLTGAVAACADSGTLLISGGPGRPLSASLLPPVHLVVLSSQKIYPRLRDLLAHEAVRQSSSAVLITGPSRTADIEMTLTVGVHGPGELWVFEVD